MSDEINVGGYCRDLDEEDLSFEFEDMSDKLKEVFEQAIPAYEKALEEFPETEKKKEALEFLRQRNLSLGICNWAEEEMRVSLSEYFDTYMYSPPIYCKSIVIIRESLRFRVDWMKKYLKENQ